MAKKDMIDSCKKVKKIDIRMTYDEYMELCYMMCMTDNKKRGASLSEMIRYCLHKTYNSGEY